MKKVIDKRFPLLGLVLLVFLTLSSCGNDDGVISVKSLTQDFKNLPDLGADFVYEGWLIFNGKEISTGRFKAKDAANQKASIHTMIANEVATYVLTIEPAKETGAALKHPSKWIFAKGTFSKGVASPSTTGALYAATETNKLDAAKGQFFLKAPSADTGEGTDANGIWFIDKLPPTKGGFDKLPKLSSKWIYEGWVVVKDKDDKTVAISTGRFSDPDKADESTNEFKGSKGVPPFPGEDYIKDPASKFPKVTFPINLAAEGVKVVVSIEPTVDDEPAPFGLKPFVKAIGASQNTGEVILLDNKFKAISGTVTIK